MTFKKSSAIIYQNVRGVAQLVARSVRDAEVVGSIPVASTKIRRAQIVHGGFCFGERGEKNPRVAVGSREKRPQVYA